MRFSIVDHAKVKACKFFAFTKKFPLVERKENMFDFVIHFYFSHFASML